MKKTAIFIFILIFLSNIHATTTRVNSLGDIEDPVTGKISGLIKDDIVDIYFNPARVNDVKAFLILSSFHIKYGSDEDNNPMDEKYEEEESTTQSKKIITTTRQYDRKGYDFKMNTGVLIPLNFINLFITYNPEWKKFDETFKQKQSTYDTQSSSLTNSYLQTHQESKTKSTIPFDATIGFNIADTVMIGIRTGYFSYDYFETHLDNDGLTEKQGEYEQDRVLFGSGIKFNFSKKFNLSFIADMDLYSKDESPLLIEGGFSGAGNNNYDKATKAYDYITTENETGYTFRFIPEFELNKAEEKFIRIIVSANIITFTKTYQFNKKGNLKTYDIENFKKNKLIGNIGASYNFKISQTAKCVYGFKYIGLLNSVNKYRVFSDKTTRSSYKDYKEELDDNFIAAFIGFDIEVTKYLFIRTGLSQGLYRYKVLKTFDTSVNGTQEDVHEIDYINKYYMPNTDFALGFYIQPVTDFIVEFNFSGSKDWQYKDVSYSKVVEYDNGDVKKQTTKHNYDLNIGMSVSYKVSFTKDKEKLSTQTVNTQI